MGAVYEAMQSQPQRRVAVKLIRSDQMSEELLRRFSVEIQALGRLCHPGIARIYEGGTTTPTTTADPAPQPYFVMELVDGVPLDEYVSTHRIGLRDCIRLMVRVVEAVHHAHAQDVIHRDLKPANILVDRAGQPKILDFGVARMVSAERVSAAAAPTRFGAIVGTLQYMSPEQAEGDPDHFDHRSDVYGLGVIMYKLLTGRLPYQFAGGFIEAVSIIHETTPTRLGDIDERLGGDLEAIVNKALSKQREHRYQTAQAFADDLQRVAGGRRPIAAGRATFAAAVRRLTVREDNIRQAGWAGVIGYGLVALFELLWVGIGVAAWFWPTVLPRDLRYTEFMLNITVWTASLAALSWISWRAARGHLASMWLALVASVLLTTFCASVLFFNSYDFAGVLRDPLVRVAVFMLYTLLALLAVLTTSLSLATIYRLRQWDRPVAQPAA